MTLCISSVIPSLFPFLVSVNLIINMRYFDFFGKTLYRLTPRWFSVSGTFSSALILGLIGGYPVGGITISKICKTGETTKEEAERALAFCNNCGPAFILGAIGNSVFRSAKIGFTLYLIHILGAVSTGFFLKKFFPIPHKSNTLIEIDNTRIATFSQSFTSAVFSSLKSSLLISGYIVFFSVIICLLKQSGILSTLAVWTSHFFGIPSEIVAAVLTGSIEMTSGIFMLPSFLGKEVTFPIASFLLGWGGFSVHFQTKSVLVDNNLNFREYYTGKLIHGIFSLIFAIIFSNILF